MAWNVSKGTLKEIAQSLQEAKKMARSIENVASSFIPLASGEQLDILKTIEQDAIDLSRKISRLYNEAAPDAFGREPTRD